MSSASWTGTDRTPPTPDEMQYAADRLAAAVHKLFPDGTPAVWQLPPGYLPPQNHVYYGGWDYLGDPDARQTPHALAALQKTNSDVRELSEAVAGCLELAAAVDP